MDLKRFDCKNTLIDAMHSGINLFVGAGFSVYAKDKNEKNLPTGNKLIEELHTIFGSG